MDNPTYETFRDRILKMFELETEPEEVKNIKDDIRKYDFFYIDII